MLRFGPLLLRNVRHRHDRVSELGPENHVSKAAAPPLKIQHPSRARDRSDAGEKEGWENRCQESITGPEPGRSSQLHRTAPGPRPPRKAYWHQLPARIISDPSMQIPQHRANVIPRVATSSCNPSLPGLHGRHPGGCQLDSVGFRFGGRVHEAPAAVLIFGADAASQFA